MDVSSSGYYEWRRHPESAQAQSNRKLDDEIRKVYSEHKQRYGVPCVTEEFGERGFLCSENRVARRMAMLSLKGIQTKKFKLTTDSNHDKPVSPDLIEQDFTALAVNQKWVSDLTFCLD